MTYAERGNWLGVHHECEVYLRCSAGKNVAEEVIDLLFASVRTKLLGTRTASFTSVHQTIKSAMYDAIVKLLTPNR